MFEVGETASKALKEFSELGDTETMDKEGTAKELFDGFVAPPIDEGVGSVHAKFFVDGNHTMVGQNWQKKI